MYVVYILWGKKDQQKSALFLFQQQQVEIRFEIYFIFGYVNEGY